MSGFFLQAGLCSMPDSPVIILDYIVFIFVSLFYSIAILCGNSGKLKLT